MDSDQFSYQENRLVIFGDLPREKTAETICGEW